MTEVGYASDKPSDCAYCYFFSAGRKKCKRKECFYRISSPPLRRKVTHWEPCEGCPYLKKTEINKNLKKEMPCGQTEFQKFTRFFLKTAV